MKNKENQLYPYNRKPSSVINEKKQENNRMGKARDLFKELEIPTEHFMQRWAR